MSSCNRRDFIRVAATASAPLWLGWELGAAATVGLTPLRWAVCADAHKDIMHDADERLRRFVAAAQADRADFIIQLGDFCRPYDRNRGFLSIWEGFHGARWHTLGNHDRDGGFKWDQVLEYWHMPARYYSFDRAGWHFVVLDGNETRPGRAASGYPRYIGAEQQAWLRRDLEASAAPTIVFSHQSLEDKDGLENGDEVRALLEAANKAARWRKVGACFSGHHHIDFVTQINGIHYVQVNSLSYQWLGEKYAHVRYSAEVDKDYPYIKYTAPYRDALFARVMLDPKGAIGIRGVRSEFVGPSPWDLGMKAVAGTALDKARAVPWISDRELNIQTL